MPYTKPIYATHDTYTLVMFTALAISERAPDDLSKLR